MALIRSKMVRLTDLVFSGAGDSNAIDADEFGKYSALTIMGPSGALAGVVTVTVARDDSAAPTYATLQSPSGTDLAIASGKAITIAPPCFPALRLHSTVNENVTFVVWGKLAVVTSA